MEDSTKPLLKEISITTTIIDVPGSSSFTDLNDEDAGIILWILTYIVCPAISILGVIGNIFSIIILKKHGLNKCSNILLFSLAISDITFLVGANVNALCRILHARPPVSGFQMEYKTAYFMFIVHNIADIGDWVGCCISFTLPVLITIERLVAVFLPLQFPNIITPKRTTIAVVCVYVFWYGILLYTRVWFHFDYNSDNAHNISVGVMTKSQLFYDQFRVTVILQAFISYLGFTLPLPIVVVGCICIGIKVKVTSVKRKKLTAGGSQTQTAENDKKFAGRASRTTKTLMSVCAVYSVACVFTTLPQHVPSLIVYALFSDAPSNLAVVIYQVLNVVISLNSSCNFLIYVGTNKKFRDTQKDLLRSCFCRGSSSSSSSGAKYKNDS